MPESGSMEAFFLDVEGGQRFCLFHPAVCPAGVIKRGQVVYVHPFAEEMNKSRRMAALQSRALADAGFDVLQIDLLGCGDSSGDFGDATWDTWVNDVVVGCHWMQQRHTATYASHAAQGPLLRLPPLWLWGLRAGCLLAAQAAGHLNWTCNFLFWQPPASGKPLLQQFLRLKVAGDMLSGQSKGAMDAMRRQLAGGASVEVAGYMLAPALTWGLENADLAPAVGATGEQRVEWFEISTREDAALSPVSAKAIEQWQVSGFLVASHLVNGPAFWQTTEIEDAPGLIEATMAAVTQIPDAMA